MWGVYSFYQLHRPNRSIPVSADSSATPPVTSATKPGMNSMWSAVMRDAVKEYDDTSKPHTKKKPDESPAKPIPEAED